MGKKNFEKTLWKEENIDFLLFQQWFLAFINTLTPSQKSSGFYVSALLLF